MSSLWLTLIFSFQWKERGIFTNYTTLAGHTYEKSKESTGSRGRPKKELVTSLIVLSLTNWSFVNEGTQNEDQVFRPMTSKDVFVQLKLSSTVFESERSQNSAENSTPGGDSYFFDKHGLSIRYPALVSLLSDPMFVGQFMQELKIRYEKDTKHILGTPTSQNLQQNEHQRLEGFERSARPLAHHYAADLQHESGYLSQSSPLLHRPLTSQGLHSESGLSNQFSSPYYGSRSECQYGSEQPLNQQLVPPPPPPPPSMSGLHLNYSAIGVPMSTYNDERNYYQQQQHQQQQRLVYRSSAASSKEGTPNDTMNAAVATAAVAAVADGDAVSAGTPRLPLEKKKTRAKRAAAVAAARQISDSREDPIVTKKKRGSQVPLLDLDEDLEDLEDENEREESVDYDSDELSLLDISVDDKKLKDAKEHFGEKKKQDTHTSEANKSARGRQESAGEEEEREESSKTPPGQTGASYKGSLEQLIPTAEQGLKRRGPKKN